MQPWLAASCWPISPHKRVASEASSPLDPLQLPTTQAGTTQAEWTGIWRNVQTMENVTALLFQASDSVHRPSLDFKGVAGKEEI